MYKEGDIVEFRTDEVRRRLEKAGVLSSNDSTSSSADVFVGRITRLHPFLRSYSVRTMSPRVGFMCDDVKEADVIRLVEDEVPSGKE